MMFHKMIKQAEAKVGRGESSGFSHPVFIILRPIILSCPKLAMSERTDLAEIGRIGY